MNGIQSRQYQLRDERQLLVRSVKVDDAAATLEFVEIVSGESSFLSFGPGELGMSLRRQQEFIRKHTTADNQCFILGSIDGELVSNLYFTAGLRPRTRHSGELGMSVRKDYWAIGVGSLMLDHAIEWARQSSVVTKMNLRVRTDNRRAIRLYERKGFVREGTIHDDFRIGDRYFDHYWMGRRV